MSDEQEGIYLREAVEKGDELLMFQCLRHYLSQQIEQTGSGRDLAALTKQFIDISERISALEKMQQKTNRSTPLNDARKSRKKQAPKKATKRETKTKNTD